MMRVYRWRGRWCVLVLIAIGGMSCRDTEPLPTHYCDLGTDGSPLPPTGSVWHNPAIATGQADWHPFRKPAVGEEAEPPAPAGDADAQGNEEIEAEIRDLVNEYNEAVADGTTDDLLEYYVEEQHDTLRPWLDAAASLARKLTALREAFDRKMPEAEERIANAFTALGAATPRDLAIETITVVSDTEATGTVPAGAGSLTYRFVVVDEEWYIEVSRIEGLAALRPAIDVALATYDGWLESLQSGPAPPDSILAQLEAAAEAAKAVVGTSGTDTRTPEADAGEGGATANGAGEDTAAEDTPAEHEAEGPAEGAEDRGGG